MNTVNKLYSVNREAGTAALRTLFEPHIYFSEGKKGYVMFSNTLANIGAATANKYVTEGYHVGFLNDSSDAAHAYAVPKSGFRAWLRGLATPVDTLQKMIDRTGTLDASSQSLGGTLADCNGHYFRNLTWLYLYTNQLSGSIPVELGNLSSLGRLYLYTNQLSGSIPVELGNLSSLGRLWLQGNQLTGYQAGAISTSQTALNEIRIQNNGTAETPFPVAGINQICEDVLASVVATPRTGTLNLSGTNMAQPTGDGLAAAQTLVDTYSWTVTLKNGVLPPT
jgi:Leucine-rich repeat (LRR) protein